MTLAPLQNDRSFLPPHITVKAAPINLTGRVFGMLTALKVVGKHQSGSLLWKCKCSCGTEIETKSAYLVANKKRSCGCDNARSKAQIERFKREASWNKGTQYQLKGDDEVFRSKKAWTDAVIRKFGNACQRCGWSEARCDAHHKVHRQDGGLNTISNAEVLCPNCHRIHHHADQ